MILIICELLHQIKRSTLIKKIYNFIVYMPPRSPSQGKKQSKSPPRRQRQAISASVDSDRSYPGRSPQYRPRKRSRQGEQRRISRNSRSMSANRERKGEEVVQENKKLFVTNIDGKIPEQQVKDDLKNQFEFFGKVVEVVVKTKPNSTNTYAFVEFQRLEDSVKAQAQMKGKKFKGKQLKVQFGNSGKRKNQPTHECYYCHKTGHFSRQCREKYKEDRHGNARDDYDYHRKKRSISRYRDQRQKRTYRRSYQRSPSGSSNYHRGRRSRSRSPEYYQRRRYDRDDRHYKQDRYRSDRHRQDRQRERYRPNHHERQRSRQRQRERERSRERGSGRLERERERGRQREVRPIRDVREGRVVRESEDGREKRKPRSPRYEE